jgi:hypothetical protein
LTDAPSIPLRREDAEFLTALAGAFLRAQMYPGGHPTLDRAVEHVLEKAEPLLASETAVSFAVGPTQLFVGDTASEPEQPFHRELASRLFRRNIGTIRIARGVTVTEIVAMLQRLIVERPESLDGATPHLQVEPLRYEGLTLESGPGVSSLEGFEDSRTAIWSELARATLGPARGGDATSPVPSGVDLAHELDALPPNEERDAAIAGRLQEAAAACRNRESPETTLLRREITQLLRELRPETLDRLLSVGGRGLNSRLALDLAQVSSAPLAIELLHAAARVEGRPISSSLVRLLGKLAAHAENAPSPLRNLALEQLHSSLRNLIEGWTQPRSAEQDASEESRSVLDLPPPLVPDLDPTEAYRSDPLRLLTMELDMGEVAAPGRRAAQALVARGRIRPLVQLLDEMGPEDPLAAQVRPLVATTDAVMALLVARPLDLETLDRLAPEVGVAAIPLLLDALATAEERSVRRPLLDLLVRFGNAVTPYALERLDQGPWYVQRNLLRLLQMLPVPPAEAVASKFARHGDVRVRIEGLRLLLRHPAARARGIVQGLSDPDTSGVRVAVMAAAEDCPPAAAPLILRGLLEGRIEAGLRATAIRAVGPLVQEPAVLDLLLRFASHRVPFLGQRVAFKSKESLAALSALARHWSWHPRAGHLLALAERHRDPEVREAVATPSVLRQLGVEPPSP